MTSILPLGARCTAGLVLTLFAASGCVARVPELRAVGDQQVSIHEPSPTSRHPIDLQDILKLKEIESPSLSPDGERVAFVVRQAFLACNCYRSALYVMPIGADASSDTARKLLEDAAISNLRWTPDSRSLTYLSSRSGSQQIWQARLAGGAPTLVFVQSPGEEQDFHEGLNNPRDTARIGVSDYEWSPDGSMIAFTSRPRVDPDSLIRMADDGIRYDDQRMWGFDIIKQQWRREPTGLWIYDTRTKRARKLWTTPRPATVSWGAGAGISDMAWSPDSKHLAVTYETGMLSTVTGYVQYDLGSIDIASGAFRGLVATDSMKEMLPTWSPDGRKLAFFSGLAASSTFDPSMSTLSLGIVDIPSGQVQYVGRGKIGYNLRFWWSSDSTVAALNAFNVGPRRRRWGVQQIDLNTGDTERITSAEDFISDCGGLVRGKVACVHQTSNEPSSVVTVELATHEVLEIADVNGGWDGDVLRSPVTEMHWTNCFGSETNGYLIRPYDVVPGKRYPLLVMLYGFQGSFVAGAERYITSWPVQVFARDGFAVLLWNYPKQDRWDGDSVRHNAAAEAYNALASLESAVRLLADSGIADTTKVGILGWSHGGFGAEFAISHSSLFRAVSLLNGGDYTPAADWMLGPFTRTINELKFGGPPSGSTLADWVAISPYFNAHRVRAPILMEYDADEAIIGLEMFEALHQGGPPVDFYIYPNDGHMLWQPVHRMVSMQRNLDWFSFWLLGRDDPDPAKKEQYARWRAMREQLRELPASRIRPTSYCRGSGAVREPGRSS